MFIQSFPSGPFDTNAYIIGCQSSKQAAIIDPAADSLSAITSCLTSNSLIPVAILLTHSHWDHIADLAEAVARYKIPVYVHQLDAANVRQPGSDGVPCWLTIAPVEPDAFLKEGDQVEIGLLRWQILHTPGHSPGSVCLYCAEKNALVSGDTLFKGTYGSISLPTAEPTLMKHSLARLAALPPDTAVYPGHGPHTTIAAELPWLKEFKANIK